MPLQPKHKLRLACALVTASMVVLSFEWRWDELRPAEPAVLVLTLITVAMSLWAAFAGRVAWVFLLLRAILQVLGMGLLLVSLPSGGSRVAFLRGQALVSLALTCLALGLLLSRAVRGVVWKRAEDAAKLPRPPSLLATPGVLRGMAVVACVTGAVEQAWIYEHLSVLELALRSVYVGLPWAGAWLLARSGRDRVALTALGALLGEMASDLLSLLVSGADLETVLFRVLLPYQDLPALLLGLGLALFGPRRPLWQLGLALPLAQLGYRAASVAVATSGGSLSWQLAVVSVLAGMGCAAAVYRFRAPPPAPQTAPA